MVLELYSCESKFRYLQPFWLKPFWLKSFLVCWFGSFHPSVVPVMSNGCSTGRRTCPPSLSCTGDMVVPSSFAPSLIAMVRAVPTMCCDRMSMGNPWLAPSAVVRLLSLVFSVTMVHWCGRPAEELVAAKRPMQCPRQRERAAVGGAGQGSAATACQACTNGRTRRSGNRCG